MTKDNDNKSKPAGNAGAARKSRDSSLYRDIYKREQAAKEAQAETGTAETPGRNAGLLRKSESALKFVLTTTDPEVIPVEHQAVITELNSSLSSIEARRHELEAQLADNHSANKLQIAQLKGRLATLRRKKLEIEALLSTRDSGAAAATNNTESTPDGDA